MADSLVNSFTIEEVCFLIHQEIALVGTIADNGKDPCSHGQAGKYS